MIKENSVAIIYLCTKEVNNIRKFQCRLQHAIEDMIEDGFFNFILPIDERSAFSEIFIRAFLDVKVNNPKINLTLMLPYEIEECFDKSPTERLHRYTQHADEVIYNQKVFDINSVPNQTISLLQKSSAVIIYFERHCAKLRYVTQYAQRNNLPLINVNI